MVGFAESWNSKSASWSEGGAFFGGVNQANLEWEVVVVVVVVVGMLFIQAEAINKKA